MFGWDVVAGATEYRIEYSSDSMFGADVVALATTDTMLQPASDFSISYSRPVGARYWWHVRACNSVGCSAFSRAWYVNVGRSAADVDGDGYADLVGGSTRNDDAGVDAGSATVYLGGPGPSFDDMQDTVILNPIPSSHNFGLSLRKGDFNGDGYGDLVIGGPDVAELGGSDNGRAFVYLGGSGGLGAGPVATLAGTPGDAFGYAVANAGDLDGDGYEDVAVGALRAVAAGSVVGRTYVYRGGPGGTFDVAPDLVLDGSIDQGLFGFSVSTAGDTNGDGYADLVVGAPGPGVVAGAAFIYFGGPALAQSGTAVTLVGNAPGDGLGTTVANAGDVNGDSFSDLLVAAVNGSGLGYVFLYWGGRAFDKTPDQEFSGEAAGDWFGESCAAAGDVNADGYGDVLIGAFANDGVGIDGGRAYLYLGGPAGVAPTPEMILTGAATGDYFGTLVAGVSDLNGDAIDDFVVGAARSDAAGTDAGAVYVFFGWGGGAADAIPDGILTGSAADDRFGIAVASLAPPYVRRMAIWAGASLAPRARLAIASAVR